MARHPKVKYPQDRRFKVHTGSLGPEEKLTAFQPVREVASGLATKSATVKSLLTPAIDWHTISNDELVAATRRVFAAGATDSQAVAAQQEIASLVVESVRVADELYGVALSHEFDLHIQREIASRLHGDERQEAWRTWRDRTVRWVASAALILAAYSGAVELSDAVGFVHVPVHDWLAQKH